MRAANGAVSTAIGRADTALTVGNTMPATMITPASPVEWQYFISHASEDKALVATPLAHYLRSVGFTVWYDDFTLRVGDSILGSIDRGLAGSRFGVVVLSPAFFSKPWPQRELAALVATATGQERRVLPVWHRLDARAVAAASPLLADLKAVSTTQGLHVVAEEIVRASYPERIGALPVSNAAAEQSPDLAAGREALRQLLDGHGQRADVLLLLSAYQSLLQQLAGYWPLVVPASKLDSAIPFDFAIVEPHGVTGPIALTLVVLGPTEDDASLPQLVASIEEAFGPPVPFLERPGNDYLRGPLCGQFPRVGALARAVGTLVQSHNVHHEHPDLWNVGVLVLSGRRTLDPDAAAERAAVASRTRVRVEVASYDRLIDEAVGRPVE